MTVVTIENVPHPIKTRPDSLILNTNNIRENSNSIESKKNLYRSQSTKSLKKSKLNSEKVLINDSDQIYVIGNSNEFYDSIDVIHERRSKNFSKFSDVETSKGNETTNRHIS